MLEHLHIKNVALIAESELHFEKGLNILTGETGAGKSMIIDSLHFALGGRVNRDFLRKEEQSAVVEALFSTDNPKVSAFLEENGISVEEDGTLLIARTMQASGKTVARVNGSTVTAGMLKELAGELLDIYGQHEHQSLLNPSRHIHLLDRFCGEVLEEKLAEYRKEFSKEKELKKQLEMLCGEESSRVQRLDILQFQKEEIEGASLCQGEEEELLEQKKRLGSVEKLMRLSVEGVQLLYDGRDGMASACDNLGEALRCLQEAAALDNSLSELCERMDNVYAQLEDGAREWKKYTHLLEADPDALETIEERLQTIYRLKRKYGGSVEAVLDFYQKAVEELDFLQNSEERAAELEQALQAVHAHMAALAGEITAIRKNIALQVQTQVEQALHDMEMAQARFYISMEKREHFAADGLDKVEFLISANAGEDLKPLAKIASGGEMSRVMLALKTVLVDADEIGTFIFDEIDTGVSGKTARKVGEKMSLLGKKRQILCITHLPQIAAMADNHFRIEKHVAEGRTTTTVETLDENASCREIARLMGGEEITETTMAAARELRREKP